MNGEGGYGAEILARFRFYGPEKAIGVGNKTNKNQRTIKIERKLLPQIKHKFLVEEWFCDNKY